MLLKSRMAPARLHLAVLVSQVVAFDPPVAGGVLMRQKIALRLI